MGGLFTATLLWALSGFAIGIPAPGRAVGVGLVAMVGALRDSGIVRLSLPESRRQVPRDVFQMAVVPASLRFGFELGTGWLTYITSTLPYVLAIAIVLLAPTYPVAALAGVGFGLARALVPFLRLLAAVRGRWDHRMARCAAWLVPTASVLGIGAVMVLAVAA